MYIIISDDSSLLYLVFLSSNSFAWASKIRIGKHIKGPIDGLAMKILCLEFLELYFDVILRQSVNAKISVFFPPFFCKLGRIIFMTRFGRIITF